MRLDRKRQKWVTAVAVLVAAMFVAGPAMADHRGHRDHDRRHHDRHYDRHEGRHYERHYEGRRHHGRHHRKHYRHHNRRHYPTYRHAGYRQEVAGYYCGPCNHRFHSYNALSRHVHHKHHIPLWQLPFVIVHSVFNGIFGWAFHG